MGSTSRESTEDRRHETETQSRPRPRSNVSRFQPLSIPKATATESATLSSHRLLTEGFLMSQKSNLPTTAVLFIDESKNQRIY
jgi:hypothetical protein